MNWFFVALVFVVGTCVGSFVNVLVTRSVSGEDWTKGRSKCDHCGKTLSWYDMVPLLSYFAYRGRSRCCQKKLSIAHPIVEGLFGALFVWWLLVGFVFFQLATVPWLVIQPLFWLGVAVILLILAVADGLHGVILMPLVYLGIGWVYIYRFALLVAGTYQWSDLLASFVAGSLSYVFLELLRWITRGRGMGDGDPYLAFLTGSLLGGVGAFWGMLGAFVLGSIWGVGLIVMRYKDLKASIPFGPFLILSCLLTLVIIRF